MLGTSLEFAPGTTEDCQKIMAQLFKPGELLGAYRMARQRFGVSDLVLVAAQHDGSGCEAMVRSHYVSRLRQGLGRNGAAMLNALGVAHKSAHEIASMPKDSDAFWVVINRRDALPVMVVLFATKYATDADASEPTILRN